MNVQAYFNMHKLALKGLRHIPQKTEEQFASALILTQAVLQILAADFKFRLSLKNYF
jgi:hypothetical protein